MPDEDSVKPRAAAADGSRGVEHLSTARCWEFLQNCDLGRLALTDAGGVPTIYPVNYVAYEGALYLRTGRDSKLFHIASRPAVGFEVDGNDDHTRWSVVIKGSARQLFDPTEVRASGILGADSYSPTRKRYVIKITPDSVTGRRFGFHMQETLPPSRPMDTARHPSGDYGRPHPIPHYPPLRNDRP